MLACFVLLAGLRLNYEVFHGGGLTAEGRARREKVRLQAAQMFEQIWTRCR